MTTEQPKHKSGPTMKPPPPPAETDVIEKEDDWRPMREAPKDGTYVYFKEDDTCSEWCWYKTRQYNGGSWKETGWWRPRFGPKHSAHFIPSGFRLVVDGLPK